MRRFSGFPATVTKSKDAVVFVANFFYDAIEKQLFSFQYRISSSKRFANRDYISDSDDFSFVIYEIQKIVYSNLRHIAVEYVLSSEIQLLWFFFHVKLKRVMIVSLFFLFYPLDNVLELFAIDDVQPR